MSEYDWPKIRADAIKRLGDAPPAEVEARILDVFRTNPQQVVAAIDRAALSALAGQIRYPWSLVANICERAVAPAADVRVVDGSDRTRLVEKALRWIVNAGCHYDRWDEVHAALFEDGFGDKGQTLKPWASEAKLVAEMRAEWERRRPDGERTEQAAEDRARRFVAHQRTSAKAVVDPDRAAALARIRTEREEAA